MRFRAGQRDGLIALALATVVVVLLTALTIGAALDAPIGPGAMLLLLLALVLVPLSVLAVVYSACFGLLSYRMGRNGLVISAGLFHLLVPMSAIEGIYTAPADPGSQPFRGLRFRGHNIGRRITPSDKRIVYLAAAPPEQCLYVATDTRYYALSPDDPQGFLRAYEASRALGPVAQWRERVRVSYVLLSLVWRDYVGLALSAGAILGGVLLLALAFWRYPNLPAEIPMHFDALGRPDRMALPDQVFYLPLIGSVVTVINVAVAIVLYRRERLLSYFAWGGAGATQLLLLLAMLSITS